MLLASEDIKQKQNERTNDLYNEKYEKWYTKKHKHTHKKVTKKRRKEKNFLALPLVTKRTKSNNNHCWLVSTGK